MNKTKIQWTETTWNPSTGCSKVSPGCAHCYVLEITKRWPKAFPQGFDFTLHPERFDAPRHWREPRTVFVNSMSDLFHEEMAPETLQRLFATMVDCPQHTFQILTKRSSRLRELAPRLPWPPNVWIGVSIENQGYPRRVEDLRQVPAITRFISAEPLLGPLELNLGGIHWVIVGGESQKRCWPFDLEWARALRDQCRAQGAAFFLKQLGGYPDKRGEMIDFPF
jgi:protein gp37